MSNQKVLILCTGNSCRSQMAEGFLRAMAGDCLEVYSAGARPSGYVHPKAIAVMQELGIDISAHESKHLDAYLDSGIHTVITVCDSANEVCPIFPGKVTRLHWSFPDPAHAEGSDEAVMEAFREVRDQIKRTFEAYAAGYRDAQRT